MAENILYTLSNDTDTKIKRISENIDLKLEKQLEPFNKLIDIMIGKYVKLQS